MKAIRFHQHGDPEVLKYEDAPEPRILANEVLRQPAIIADILLTREAQPTSAETGLTILRGKYIPRSCR